MEIIAIANQKGGVAKTTTTHNLGTALAEKGHKVLLIDLDPQANLTICLGLEPQEEPHSIVDTLQKRDNVPASDCIHKIDDNLDIITSIIDLSGIEMELIMRPGREKVLERAIAPIRDRYEYILIDCPPQLSILTINALSCADEVIVPVATDYLSYRGLTLLMDTVAEIRDIINPKLKMLGVIATFYEKRVKDDRAILSLLKKEYRVIGVIKKAVDTRKGIYEGLSIVQMYPISGVAQQYKRVAEKIVTGNFGRGGRYYGRFRFADKGKEAERAYRTHDLR